MPSVWLTREQVMELTGWSRTELYRRVRKGTLETRDSETVSRNGKPVPEYSPLSLPIEAQKKALTLRLSAAADPVEIVPAAKAEKQKQLSLPIPDDPPNNRTILPPELEKQARERYDAIAPLLCFRPVPDRAELRSLRAFVEWLAPQRNVSAATLWRWHYAFKKHGYAALCDRARSDKGRSRFFCDNPVLADFVEKKYCAERLSIRMVHEALARECAARNLDAPDYKTVRVYLRTLPKALTIISREGERQYHDRCEMFVVKKYDDRLANDIWVSDHMIHDCWVRNDRFPDHPRDAALRPWTTGILDYRSRKAVGNVWCATPSSDTISAALRPALLAFGPPKTFYIDNGKDYKSLARENALSPQASGVLVRLGVESQYCQPLHPQSKHIEAWHKTFHSRFDTLWRPFYCGTSPATRPEECEEMLKEHRAALKAGDPDRSPLPLASEFIRCAQQWIVEYNAQHKHTGRGMDGKAPDEIFDAEYPVGQRRSCDPRALDILLRRRETRKVREGGCVEINGHRYEPADAASTAALILEIEREVLIACDPANMGEAIALDLDGHYLGTMQASKLMEHGPVSREEIRASMRQRRQVKRALKEYGGGLIARSYARGEKSDLELLRQRAGLESGAPRVQRMRALPPAAREAVARVGYDGIADKFYEEDY